MAKTTPFYPASKKQIKSLDRSFKEELEDSWDDEDFNVSVCCDREDPSLFSERYTEAWNMHNQDE